MMNVYGSAATLKWYVLSQPRSYYVYDMDGDGEVETDFTRAATDCTYVADPDIYYPGYVGINMMFNGDLDGYAWGGGFYLTLDGVSKTWFTTWEPTWGYEAITVIADEMGHGFGLPHSSGEYGQTYDNQWDVMSDAWTNCDCSTDPTFRCLGQHTIAYHKNLEGWVGSKLTNVPQFSETTVILEQLAVPQTSNALMAEVPINGSSSLYYTVEVRRNVGTGYDVKLSGSAVIIHEVNTERGNSAHVKDADGNGNTGDAGAQWLPGEIFTDPANKITITINSATSTGFSVTICNACNEPTPTPGPTATATTIPDTEKPVLHWVKPVSDTETYYSPPNENVLLEVNATDNVEVAKVHFLRYDALNNVWIELGDDFTAPFQYNLDVRTLNPEWNQINAYALDNSGNGSDSPYIWIYKTNPTQTPTPTPTRTATATGTATYTPTPSSTNTATATNSCTPTVTRTATPTATATNRPTRTQTQTILNLPLIRR